MTQPRAKQIKDPQAKFSLLPAALSATLTSQSVNWSGGNYAALLAGSVTGVLGGCGEDFPATATSVIAGSYPLTDGQTFNISINGNAPISVVIQASDIVMISGSPRVTTSLLANRINTATSGGVVADNHNGFLRVTSVSTGANATLTLSDVTAGTMATIGFNSPQLITGINAQTRGIITNDRGLAGGQFSFRNIDGTPSTSTVTSLIHLGSNNLTANILPGQPMYGRITKTGASQTTVKMYTYGALAPSITSTGGDFASLTSTDTITITFVNPGGSNFVFSPIFTNSIGTSSDVVDIINAAWAATGSSYSPAQAAVRNVSNGPFNFDNSTSGNDFWISFNGQTAFQVNLATGSTSNLTQVSVANMVTAINTAISNAGQATQGQAVVTTVPNNNFYITIQSLSATGPASSVELFGGSGSAGVAPGTDLRALDKLGFSPTFVTGSYVCITNGGEITITNPLRVPGSQLLISGGSTVMAKLAFPSSVTVNVTAGEEPYTPVEPLKALLPEVMEFGEIPDDNDSVVQAFSALAISNTISPQSGGLNDGQPPVLDSTGHLDPGFLPKQIPFLAVDQMVHGGGLSGQATNAWKPRHTYTYNSNHAGRFLISDISDDHGTQVRIRTYADSGKFYVSTNAYWSGGSWNKDSSGVASSLTIYNGGQHQTLWRLTTDNATWGDTNWREAQYINAGVAETSNAGGPAAVVNIGGGFVDSTANNLFPRINFNTANDGVTYTLIWQAKGLTGVGYRLYAVGGANVGGNQMWLTINAKIVSGSWTKDSTGVPASGLYMDGIQLRYYGRAAGNDTAWGITVWDVESISADATTGIVDIQTSLAIGDGDLDTLAEAITARLTTYSVDSGVSAYTLIWATPNPNGGSPSMRIYAMPDDFTQGFIYTTNASWDGANWNADSTAAPASKVAIGNHPSGTLYGVFAANFKNTTSAPWDDSSWDANGISMTADKASANNFTVNIDGAHTALNKAGGNGGDLLVGSFIEMATADSGGASAVPGVFQDNIVKAWGIDDSGSTHYAYGCTMAYSNSGGAHWTVVFATAMANTHYLIIPYAESQTLTASHYCTDVKVTNKATGGFTLVPNPSDTAPSGGLSFVAIGVT